MKCTASRIKITDSLCRGSAALRITEPERPWSAAPVGGGSARTEDSGWLLTLWCAEISTIFRLAMRPAPRLSVTLTHQSL